MSKPPFTVAALQGRVDRSAFSCGVPTLDDYFRSTVTQAIKRKLTKCFVAIENKTSCVAGFYTLSASSVVLTDLPDNIRKKLPRYPIVAVALLGRWAVDAGFQRRGLGSALLADAMEQLQADTALGIYALVVEAKDDQVVGRYKRYGFARFDDRPRTLFQRL